MSYSTGTATNAFDLFDKIRAFAVTAGWTVLKYLPATVINTAYSVGLSLNTTTDASHEPNTIWDPDGRVNTRQGGSVSWGSADVGDWISMEMDIARAIDTFVINFPSTSQAVTRFAIEYSDDGSTWNMAVDKTASTVTWIAGVDQSFPSTNTDPHKYWRFRLVLSNTTIRIAKIVGMFGGTVVTRSQAELYLRGPGLSAADEIYVNMRLRRSPVIGEYFVMFDGATGFDTNLSFFMQPGSISLRCDTGGFEHHCPLIPIWDQPMTYWFSGDGRAILGVVKITTVYESFFTGLITQYATPGQYPYPMVIAGSATSDLSSYVGNFRPASYTKTGDYNCGISSPLRPVGPTYPSTMYLRNPAGSWVGFDNQEINGVTGWTNGFSIAGASSARAAMMPHQNGTHIPSKTLGGKYVAMPLTLCGPIPGGNIDPVVWGELPRAKWISGFEQSAENTTTIDSIPYIIFQTAGNTGQNNYFMIQAD